MGKDTGVLGLVLGFDSCVWNFPNVFSTKECSFFSLYKIFDKKDMKTSKRILLDSSRSGLKVCVLRGLGGGGAFA